MLARLATAALVGLTAHPVGVEVDVGRGLPAVTVVGLGGTSVLEARDRLRAAFGNTGYEWPDRRITVSLPPADLPKQGSGFDLPIAIGLLAAAGWVPEAALDGLWAIGELGLGGDVRAVKGVLPAAVAARRSSARLLVVPQANLVEAALVPGLRVAGAASLGQVGEWLAGRADLGRPGPPPDSPPRRSRTSPTSAASGRPAGPSRSPPPAPTTCSSPAHPAPARPCWQAPPGLLPPLERDEALEVTQVFSAAGLLGPDATSSGSAVPASHHAISVPGLVGGGQCPRPGEVPRQPRGAVPGRAAGVLRAACEAPPAARGGRGHGLAGHDQRPVPGQLRLDRRGQPLPVRASGGQPAACRCSLYDLRRYASRLSGPLLDRVDLYVQVDRLTADRAARAADAEPTASVRFRVLAARALQRSRQGAENGRLDVGRGGRPLPGDVARPPPSWPPSTASASAPAASTAPSGSPGRSPTWPARTGRGPPRQGGPQPPPPPHHRRP